MEINGERQLSLPPEKVWDGLMDVRVLRASVPGCESVTDEGDGVYQAVVLASVGPVRARFKGRLRQRELRRPSRYALEFEGESGIAGFATGSAVVELAPQGDGGTLLTWRATSQIGGRLAQIGSRLIDATVARMSAQFFDRFEEVVADPGQLDAAPAAAAAEDAVPSAQAARRSAPSFAGPVAAGALPGVVQMPGWVFATSVVTTALLIGWIIAH